MKRQTRSRILCGLTAALLAGCGPTTPGGSYNPDGTCNTPATWVPDAYTCDPVKWCEDLDSDGHGDTVSCLSACEPPSNAWARTSDDCDDSRAEVHPDAPEACNGLDDNCDGTTDEGVTGDTLWYADLDGDGFGDAGDSRPACSRPPRTQPVAGDCDDDDAGAHPGANEVPDGQDQDCDGQADEGTETADFDQDGTSAADGDCNDTNPAIHPGAEETCDGVDSDCDQVVDEDATDPSIFYVDADGDGVGAGAPTTEASCTPPGEGYSRTNTDCDDSDPARSPAYQERWGDEIDQDCDGVAPSADAYVSPTGAYVAPGIEAPVYTSIVQAIDASTDGTRIAVEPGTYSERVRFYGKAVHVFSMGGPAVTVIDGAQSGSVVRFIDGEGRESILEGFTLTRGSGTDGTQCGFSQGFTYGGGVCIRGGSPTLRDLVVTSNGVTGSGGGIYAEDGAPLLDRVTVSNNQATYDGGGLNLSGLELALSQCVVTDNHAGRGGGGMVLNASSGRIDHTLIANNRADSLLAPPLPAPAPVGGGGILISASGEIELAWVILANNSAGNRGGAVHSVTTSGDPLTLRLTHTVLVGNQASSGGGLMAERSRVTAEGSIFSGNTADSGANVSLDGEASFEDGGNLFWSEGASGVSGLVVAEESIVADPMLVSPPTDVHLLLGSPAVDVRPEDPDVLGDAGDLGGYGGAEGGDWDLDGDGLSAHPWPGLASAAPDGVSPGEWDCDDRDPSASTCP